MKPRIYIDGREGTTGLQIYERLGGRDDIDLLLIDEDKRKDTAERKKLINSADIVFLCLPDDAAREAVTLIDNPDTRVIDASTAHRTAPGWAYGFPELSEAHREQIAQSKRVANPGCHATGFLSFVYPLVALGLLAKDCAGLTCFSLTGYSGGGKKMIASYENGKSDAMNSPGIYGLTQGHKHLPEMMAVSGLTRKPVFCPVVSDYYAGMATTVMFPSGLWNGASRTPTPTIETLRSALAAWYADSRFISVDAEPGFETLYSNWGVGTNKLRLIVSGDNEAKTVTAQFDNLGKGASGAAVQNMNIMLGFKEDTGL